MDKRIYIIGGLLLIFIILLVLFFTTRGPKTPIEKPVITIWDSFDSEENFADIFQTYQAENKDIEIKFVKKDPASFEEESVNAFAAGGGPDIWVIPNNWLPKHHDKLATLAEKTLDPKAKKNNDEIYKNTFLPVAYQDNVLDGQVFGLPLFIDSLALFYNSELFSAKFNDYVKAHRGLDTSTVRGIFNDPPKTWDDLSEFIKYYGQGAIALGGAKTIDRSSDILTALMLQYGAKMTADDKTAALFQTSTNVFSDVAYPGTKALRFYTSFATKDEPNYTWDNSQTDYQAFVSGKVAMMINYSRKAADIKKDSGRAAEVTSLPQIKDSQNPIDLASYQTFTVPKTSKNQTHAWDLIRYLSGPQIQTKYLAKTGLASSLKEKVQGSTNYIDLQNQYSASWYNPEPKKADEIFKKAIEQVLAGENPQTVLEGAAAEVTTLLGGLKKQSYNFIPKAKAAVTTDFGSANDIGDYVNLILKWLMPIVGGLGVLMLIYAGYIYITSQGNPEALGQAKDIIIGVVVGIMLLFLIELIVVKTIGVNLNPWGKMTISNINLPPSRFNSLAELVGGIIDWLLVFAGVLAVIAIVYSGLMYITSGGDPAKAETAKKNLVWAIIGIVIIALAFVIVNTVV